eukprot:CAMPEP_0197041022 /NCGR_PEP_ID=MMETSP1384-20130603/17633_1 /TAXON_ID=29189 /ORGANISM="Ammonia sp." /LENGTH=113 /DNA_ID=CAMNT_0042471873 /DNA_START=203 /DNA_END=540 /DNA_ORIENTATION=+
MNTLVKNDITDTSGFWIGYELVSGSWQWIGYQGSTYSNWDASPIEPSGNGNCVRVEPQGTWDDVECSTNYRFVCADASDYITMDPSQSPTKRPTAPTATPTSPPTRAPSKQPT